MVWIFGQVLLEVVVYFDLLSDFEDFDLCLWVICVELKWFNDFVSVYGKFDFNVGIGDLVLEVQVKCGQLDGYIKLLLCDVDVFNWWQDVEDGDKNLFCLVWEVLVGGGEMVLKNQCKDQFVICVSLSGNIYQWDVSVF